MMAADYFPLAGAAAHLEARPERILYGTDFPNLPYAWDREVKQLLALKLPKSSRRRPRAECGAALRAHVSQPGLAGGSPLSLPTDGPTHVSPGELISLLVATLLAADLEVHGGAAVGFGAGAPFQTANPGFQLSAKGFLDLKVADRVHRSAGSCLEPRASTTRAARSRRELRGGRHSSRRARPLRDPRLDPRGGRARGSGPPSSTPPSRCRRSAA